MIKANGINYYSQQGNVEIKVEQFGQVNEPVEISYNGMLNNVADSTVVPFSGNLRMIRK